VFGQRARTAHEVKDQGGQQLCQGHTGFAPARTVSTARQRLERFGGRSTHPAPPGNRWRPARSRQRREGSGWQAFFLFM
jgi:hypothetical protein